MNPGAVFLLLLSAFCVWFVGYQHGKASKRADAYEQLQRWHDDLRAIRRALQDDREAEQ